MSSQPNNQGIQGSQDPLSTSSEFNAHAYVINSLIGKMATATLVKVVAVTPGDPVGFVDILPLVSQVDGDGNAVPHGVIYGCPYLRMQGGSNAVIIDPVAGDIGIAIFADHDISSVIATKKQATPGSRRRFDMSDGLYLGGFLNGAPTQYVRFSDTGLDLVSPMKITLTAPTIDLVGDVAVTGTLTDNGINVGSTHVHSGVTTGSDDSGPPI